MMKDAEQRVREWYDDNCIADEAALNDLVHMLQTHESEARRHERSKVADLIECFLPAFEQAEQRAIVVGVIAGLRDKEEAKSC